MTINTLRTFPHVVKALNSAPSALFCKAKEFLDEITTKDSSKKLCGDYLSYLVGVVDTLYEVGKIDFDLQYKCLVELDNFSKKRAIYSNCL